MRKALFFIFFLFLIGGFLFLPKISMGKEISVEDLIDDSEKIQLEEDEGKHVLRSLIQKLHDEWEAVVLEGGDKVKEKEVALLVVKKAAQKDLFNYLFLEAPKEIGKEIVKMGAKIIAIIWGGDSSTITKEVWEEIEKMSVSKAKEYTIKWLLQNQIKVTGGNLSVSYYSLKADSQHIIVYRPLDVNKGRISINFYSSSIINNIPSPRADFKWEGGIDKVPPFMLEIEGIVEKDRYGNYVWIEGPRMNFVFDQAVPKFTFKELSFFDKWKSKIRNNLLAFSKLKDKIGWISEKGQEYGTNFWENMKSILSDLNPFQTTASLGNLFPEDYKEADFSEIETEEDSSGSSEDNSGKEDKNRETKEDPDEESQEFEEVSRKEKKARQDVIDDILEKIDILNSKIDELAQEEEEESEEEKSKKDEEKGEKEEENEENEEEEDEESGTRGSGGSSEPNYCDIPASNPSRGKIILNEIAWMGTGSSSNDEWIELKNISNEIVNISGWQILDKDGQIEEILGSKELQPGEFYLLERTDDSSVPGIAANHIYKGGLNNTEEALYIFDADCQLQDKIEADPDWLAGDNENKKTMERGENLSWHTFSGETEGIKGTPKAENSFPKENVENILEVSPEMLLFELVKGETASSTKIVNVNIEGEEISWTASSSADWLTANPISAASSQEVDLSADCSELAPGNYSADIVFSAGDLEKTAEVELTVKPKIESLNHAVISEIQLGDKEFVELYNPKDIEIDVSDWYFSYYPSSRDKWNEPYRNKQFSASSSIPAKGYYLIGLKGYPDILGNPASDWQVYSSSQLNDSEGSVAIFPWNPEEKTSLEAESGRIDAVGWGEVSIKEGESHSPSPEGKSLNRIINSDYQDTDFNSFDFKIEDDPNPTNSRNEIYSLPPTEKFDWPMVQQNAQHTGRSKYKIPENLKEKWSFILENSISDRRIYGSYQPIIGKEGIIYYSLREVTDDHQGKVYAVNPNGTEKWIHELKEDFPYAPSVGSDGTIYIPTYKGFVYALDFEGEEKWRFDTEEEKRISKIAVGDYHNIYFTDHDYLYSVNSQGKLNWKQEGGCGGAASMGPALGEGGTIYVSWTGFKNMTNACRGDLYAFNPLNGSIKWDVPLNHDATAPALTDDGNIYLIEGSPWAGHEFRTLKAYDSTGAELWSNEKEMDGSIRIPKITSNNKIIITDNWGDFEGWSWGTKIYRTISKIRIYSSNGVSVWESEDQENLSFENDILVGAENKILAERKIYDDKWKFPQIGRKIELFDNNYNFFGEVGILGEFLSSFSAGKEYIYFVVKDEENEKIELKAFGEGPEKIKGCTDPEAINHNPEAETDDGSCILPEIELENLDSASSTSGTPFSPRSATSSTSTPISSSSTSPLVPPKEDKPESSNSSNSTSTSSTEVKNSSSTPNLEIESSSSTPDIILEEKNSSSTEKVSSTEEGNLEKEEPKIISASSTEAKIKDGIDK